MKLKSLIAIVVLGAGVVCMLGIFLVSTVSPAEVEVMRTAVNPSGQYAVVYCRRNDDIATAFLGSLSGAVRYSILVGVRDERGSHSDNDVELSPSHDTLESAKATIESLVLSGDRSEIVATTANGITYKVPVALTGPKR